MLSRFIMKRAIVNFSSDFSYEDFKDYSEKNKVSLSRALLELAQKSLNRWKDEQIADLALEREKNSDKESYIEADEFWKDMNV